MYLLVILPHRRFVGIQFRLDLRGLIAGCPIQILLRIGKLIRVQSELRFCHFQIAFVIPAGVPFLGVRQFNCAVMRLNVILVLSDELLQLRNPFRKRQGIASESEVLCIKRGLAQRRRECLVYFVVRKSLGFLRKLLLLRGHGERSKGLRSLPRTHIHNGFLPDRGVGVIFCIQEREVSHRIARRPRKHKAHCQQR